MRIAATCPICAGTGIEAYDEESHIPISCSECAGQRELDSGRLAAAMYRYGRESVFREQKEQHD